MTTAGGSLFDPLVDAYDAARPSYPAALYDDVERLARPLSGAMVVELGAGTGIATGQLMARGANVVALDAGPAMLARLLARLPASSATAASGSVLAARANAHALPVPDNSTDLVVAAQAWHWFDVPRAAAEAARVLRPGGSLALWWNDVLGAGVDWLQRQYDRIEGGNPAWQRTYRERDYGGELGPGWAWQTTECRWERELPVKRYLTWLASKSYVAALADTPPGGLDTFMANERASLAEAFPDGVVIEPFRTLLVLARPSG